MKLILKTRHSEIFFDKATTLYVAVPKNRATALMTARIMIAIAHNPDPPQ